MINTFQKKITPRTLKTKLKLLIVTLVFSILLISGIKVVSAQTVTGNAQLNSNSLGIVNDSLLPATDDSLVATDSAQQATDSSQLATQSGSLATPSAEVQEKIQERKDRDLTETAGEQKGKLATFLDENPIEPLSWNNFIQHGIRYAVQEGVPANVIVLIILFPLVSSIIGASRHVIGFRGFGMYIPAVLSVALVSTGIIEGLLIFGAIVTTALGTKNLLKKAKIAYLPRTAMLIWTISLGLLALFILVPFLNISSLVGVNIFPILILVLLAENLLDALVRTKPADAIALTAETLALAFISSLILQLESLQKLALAEPELLVLAVAFFNIFIGKFAGLRLAEFLRFRSIIEEE
jgi:hypothetical protein